MYYRNWAIVVPMANEEPEFADFIALMRLVIHALGHGAVYMVVDTVSKDRTLELCRNLSAEDPRFVTLWAPDNRNVVDAYLYGFRAAYDAGHELIIEMDAGLSHDPRALPMFLRVLNEGNECAFGSRFINGGSLSDSPVNRRWLSKGGTVLANLLLGTRLYDMTSGYEGFHRDVIAAILTHRFRSTGHFSQTELRYLLRNRRSAEVPIHYKAPSPSVSQKSLRNAWRTLGALFWERLTGRTKAL